MKRFFSLLLALMLVMSLAVTAFAETTGGSTTNTVTLRVNGEHSGHTYVAYQIFKGDVTSQGVISNVSWGTGISNPEVLLQALKTDEVTIGNAQDPTVTTTLKNEFKDASNAADIATKMATWGDNRERINYFADFLYNKVHGESAKGFLSGTYETAVATTANPTIYEFTLEPGYYLIKDQDASVDADDHDFYTKFIVALTSDVTVAVKGTVPRVEKKVSNTLQDNYGSALTSQLNLTHYYELIGYLPSNIGDYTSYSYKFVDTLEEGLHFLKIEEVYLERTGGEKVYFYKYGETSANNWAPVTNSTGNVVTIEWENLKAEGFPPLVSSDKIIVKYSAKLTENAVVGEDGNHNEVKLIYSNNPHGEGTGTTVTAKTTVYTFGLKVIKIDSATKNEQTPTTLAGAKFKLYHEHGHENSTERLFAVVDGAGMITNWVTDEAQGTELTTDSKGLITVKGLKEGVCYYLRETVAPSGFNLLMRDIPVEITSYVTDDNGNITAVVYEADNIQQTITCTDGIITATVENKGGNTLPSTGGTGTTVMYIAGGILVLAAVVLLVTKKRMSGAE